MAQEGPNEGVNRPVEIAALRKVITGIQLQSGLTTLRNDPRTAPPQPRPNEHALTRFFRLDSLAPSADPSRPQPNLPELNQKNIKELVEQSRKEARTPGAAWDQQMTATALEYYLTRERLPDDIANRNQVEVGASMHMTRLLTNMYGATEFISTFDRYVAFLEANPSASIHRNAAMENRLTQDAHTLTAIMPYWGRVMQVHFLSILRNPGPDHQAQLKDARVQLEVARKAARAAGVEVPADDVSNYSPAALLQTISPVEGRLRDIIFTQSEEVTPPRHTESTLEHLARLVTSEEEQKRVRAELARIGITEAAVQPIRARRVHAAYINLLADHRRSESDQIIKKAGSGRIPPEAVAQLFQNHQQVGQLIMQEHIFGFQTTTTHMFAGTLGLSTTLQQNPERRGNAFTPNQSGVVFADFLQLMEATPGDPGMQKSMQEQREKSTAAVRNYIQYMRQEALQLRASLRLVDLVYVQPAIQDISNGIRAISDFIEGSAATVANWSIWGPIISHYFPGIIPDSLRFETDPARHRQEVIKRLEAARKEAQQELEQVQSLGKTIEEARNNLEQAQKDLAPHLTIIEAMDAQAMLDQKRVKEAQAAVQAIAKIEQGVSKIITQTWNRIEVNMKRHAETAATMGGVQNSIARTAGYCFVAAGVIFGNYYYNRFMAGSLTSGRAVMNVSARMILSAALPFYPAVEAPIRVYQWARSGAPAATAPGAANVAAGAANAANLPAVVSARPHLNEYRNLNQRLEKLRADLRGVPRAQILQRQGIGQQIVKVEEALRVAREAVMTAIGGAEGPAHTRMLMELLGRTEAFTAAEMQTLAAMRQAFQTSATAFDQACTLYGIAPNAELLNSSRSQLRIVLGAGTRALSGAELEAAVDALLIARNQIATSQLQALSQASLQGRWVTNGTSLAADAELLLSTGATGHPSIGVLRAGTANPAAANTVEGLLQYSADTLPFNEAAAVNHAAEVPLAQRAGQAEQFLQGRNIRTPNLSQAQINARRLLIGQAHAIAPSGETILLSNGQVRTLWTMQDLRTKTDILLKAQSQLGKVFTPTEATALLRGGYCGLSMEEVAAITNAESLGRLATIQRLVPGLAAAQYERLILLSAEEFRGFLVLSPESRVLVLQLEAVEIGNLLKLCGTSLEARTAILAIRDASALRRLVLALADPAVLILLEGRSAAGVAEAVVIFSDASRAAEAAVLVREAQAAGNLAGRSRLLGMLARGGGALWSVPRAGLGILHRAAPVLAPLAVAGEAYTMYDNEQANQSMEVAHKTLEQSMRTLLGTSFREESRSVSVATRSGTSLGGETASERHTVFVHTSGVEIDLTAMLSAVEELRGSDFIRRSTDIAAIIGAYAMLLGPVGIAAGSVLMLGSLVSRTLQAQEKARLWRSFIGDVPKVLLSIVPSNIFGGDRLDNYQLYVFLRSHPGNGSAYVNTPRFSDTPSNNVFTRREEELQNDDVLQRVVLRSFVQECEKQQLPAQVMQERPGETLSQSVIRDIEFLHRAFARLFTNETPEGYQNAVTEAVALWKRQRLAIFVERGRAQLAVSQDDVRGNLLRDLAPVLQYVPAPEPDAFKGSIASLIASITPGSPEEGGAQALSGDMLLPLELLETAQALGVLRAVGRLPAQDRTALIRALQILPDITVRAQLLERFGSQPAAVQDLILRASRTATQAGGMGEQAHEALRALVESAANSMPGGASFTVGEYVERRARGQATPGYAPLSSTGGLSNGSDAVSNSMQLHLPVNEQFQDIDRLVRGILEQMGARQGRTTLSADGNSRVEATGGAGLDCLIATEGTGPNARTYFFHYNPETRRWFWASATAPGFIPVNRTLVLSQSRRVEVPRRDDQDYGNNSNFADRASVMERMAQYAPHPQATRVWELASQLIQRNNGSDGAQILPATFPGGIEGFRYVYQGKEIQLASIGGWIRWKSPTQQGWSFVGADLYPNPQPNSSEQWFNILSRQLSGLQESMRTTDRAKKGLDAGSAFLRNALNIQALVQIDGHPGFRITEQGRTLEAVCMGGLWFFHLNTGSPWADPALQSPAETYKVLRPVTSALARMNASAEPIEVYAAMSTAKIGGESILQALSERGQKAVAAYDADALGRIERSNRAEMQPLVPFPRDLVTLGIRMRGDSMTLVERQEQGLAVTRIGSSRSSTFVELRCIAGQWQTRLGSTADAEADRKAQETTGEWVAIATGGQTLQQRVKTLRSTLRAPVLDLGRSARSPQEQQRNGDSRIQVWELEESDKRSEAARKARFEEASAEYRRGQAEAQFLDNCIVVVGRVTAVSLPQ